MPRKISGTSSNGDLHEALKLAIQNAKDSFPADYVKWELLGVHGENGGFLQVDNLTVTISARGPAEVFGEAEIHGEAEAFFQIIDESKAKDRFVVKLTGENIEHARRILNGEEKDLIRIQGTIIKSTAHYNPAWSFHLDSTTINFFKDTIELCDSTMLYIEEHLEEIGNATLPGCHWCPWSSKVIAEIPAKDLPAPKTSQE